MPHDTAISECPDTIRWGRRAPIFVPTPEWILVAGLSPQAQALYTQLLAHVNRKRGDGVAWPGMDALAELLGYSRRQSVVRYVRELVGIGAIDVTVEPTATGRRNIYVVNEIVADGYAGITTLAEFHAARKARKRGSDALAPHPSDGLAAHRSGARGDENQTNATRRIDPDEDTSSDAASGRHFAGSTTDRTIFIPHWLKRCEDRGKVSQYLVGAAVATMEAAGLEVSEDAKDAMGFTLDHKCESLTNMQLAERAQAWVLAAGTDDRNGWLGTWPQRKAS